MPTLSEVRELVATMVELSTHGWIGEGEQIAQDLLAYIDGDQTIRDEWDAALERARAQERSRHSAWRIAQRRKHGTISYRNLTIGAQAK